MNRELDIKDFLDNVRTKFADCNSISYNFSLYDRNGELKNSFKNKSANADKEEKAEGIISLLETFLTNHEEIAKVHAVYGGLQRQQQVIADYLIRSNDDETKEQLRMQLEEANRTMGELEKEKDALNQHIIAVKEANQQQQAQRAERTDIVNTDYSRQVIDTMAMFADALGIKGQLCGTDGSISRYGMGVLMQVQQKKIVEDLERNKNIETIQKLKDENAELKATIKEMRREYERMENECEDLKDYKREVEPLMEDYKRLKTKSGMISAGLGNAFGQMLAGFAAKTKFAPLLGVLDDEEEEQPQPQPNEQPMTAVVQPADADEYEND